MSCGILFDLCCGKGEERNKLGGFLSTVTYRTGSSVSEVDDGETDNHIATDWVHNHSKHSSSLSHKESNASQNEKSSCSLAVREKGQVALELKRGKEIYSQPLSILGQEDGSNNNNALLSLQDYQHPVYPKSFEEEEFLRRTLERFVLFEELSSEEITKLVESTERYKVTAGTNIVKQNQNGQYLQIIQQGKVDLYCEIQSKTCGTLQAGDIFGEVALLYGEIADVSYNASSPTATLWRIDHAVFRHILAYSAHQRDSNILACLQKIPMFQSMGECQLTKFADSMTRVTFHRGERIVTKGDEGTVFYLVEDGSVKVHDIGIGDSKAVDQFLQVGDCFGERSLLTGEPRAAHVTAESDTVTLLAMDRDDFQRYMGELKEVLDFDAKLRSLKSLPILADSDLTPVEFERLAQGTIEVCYRKETKLVVAGNEHNEKNLWIIRSGRVLVYGGSSGKVYNLQSGDTFGERNILRHSDDILQHDAIAEENLTTWMLSREILESVLVDLRRLGKDARFVKKKPKLSIKVNDLKKHRILGEGAFGKVWLTENTMSKTTPYALKIVNKRRVLRSKQSGSVMRERELLGLLNHPFILDMVASFQDSHNLYMLLPLIQGGELFSRVASASLEHGGGLSSKESAFYTGCVVEALGHFHHRYIAYRDLKLENVMIDADGYCKIVDLGFAKVVVGKTYTFCGTPEYLAPEIIMSKGHNHAVDYWSLGVLIFIMQTGQSPFYRANISQMAMFKKIVMVEYEMHPAIDPLAADLIRKLLVRKVPERLGNLKHGYHDVNEHAWFSDNGYHYKKLLKKEVEAPWKPTIQNPFDASNFEEYDSTKSDERGFPLSVNEQKLFEGF
ncbi:unnamed protein product [Cylindrotheca closterium]|uniref:cGMP-dependent protein kinase n=1 Tax=Cylindrotheca closterium TaxID=2856 RepID=A0AAD2JJP3_9STRA|nr:unnamed protein product [Cylindrotheca closterium]